MLSLQWTKNELEEVEVCPFEQASMKYKDVDVLEIGQVLTPFQVKDEPTITWNCKPDTLYAIFMMDPDAPSRKEPKYREWFHWAVLNIPGTNIAGGDVMAQYIGAAPPSKTGLHRYVFLIYEQKGKVKLEDPPLKVSMEGRFSHKVKNFASKFSLGSPIAGSCFQAEYDDYVAEFYAKFK